MLDYVRERKKVIVKCVVLLFWILVWQLLAMLIHNSILFASPVETCKALLENGLERDFWKVVFMTLFRIGLGFVAGLSCGILLASISKVLPWVEEFINPVIALMKTVPVVCFVVLFLVWWGSSFLCVAICFLMVFTTIYFNTLEGLGSVDKDMLEMARVFRLPFSTKVFYVYRPALKPHLLGGMKTALGMAWKAGVAAEVIGLPGFSIGERLYLSKISLDTAGIFAWTVVICLLSFCFEKMVLFLATWFFRAKFPCRAPRRRAETSRGLEIVMENVSKSYGGQSVLRGYDESIHAGEVKWYRWGSGCGKTTLFRMIMGLEKPDAGTIDTSPEGEFCVLFQENRLCEDATAVTNVEMVTGDVKKARGILSELLEESLLEKPCRELSGGEKRRVALARALAFPGACLILDEPFAGLDGENLETCLRVIMKWKGERTLLAASHVANPSFEEGNWNQTPKHAG